jgi:hypothetical protein
MYTSCLYYGFLFGTSRLSLTFLGFIYGYTLDLFTNTPGLHAALVP